MKILINEKNEILGYVTTGGVDGFIEYDGKIPDEFYDKFKPKFYMLVDGVIIKNPNYVAPEPLVVGPSKQDKINAQIMLNQAKQKEEQDKFNAQTLLQLAKLGGAK